MVNCHALNCRSISINKIRFFRFPRDKNRQVLWLQNCGKNTLHASAKLCEFHFDDVQFEHNRVDGWRKLKPNAVPTLFVHNLLNSSEAGPIREDNSSFPETGPVSENYLTSSEASSALTNNSVPAESGSTLEDNSLSPEVSPPVEVDSSLENRVPIGYVDHSGELNSMSPNLYPVSGPFGEIERLKNIILSQRMEMDSLHKKNRSLQEEVTSGKRHIFKLNKKLKHTTKKYKTVLGKIDNIPIIKYFAKEMKHPKGRWCPESLKFATQIRYAVGWKAYIYLKKELGIPLPSYSTITRNTNQLDFKPGILNDMVTLMEAKKKSHKSSKEADCIALIDEIDIQPALEYDISTVNHDDYLENCNFYS